MKRWTLALLVVVIAALAYSLRDTISLDYLAARESQLRRFQENHPLAIYGVAFLIYVAVTGLSLPGAAPLTLLFAWYFGFWRALILVSFASTSGATIAFLISRYLLGDLVQQRFGKRLATFNEHLESEGAYYLFTLRLIPLFPFFVINLVMGLTPVGVGTYWWVSQVGMLPGTAVYTYAGSRVPDLQRLADEGAQAVFSGSQLLQFGLAFAMLAAFPWITRFALGSRARKVALQGEQTESGMVGEGMGAEARKQSEIDD